MCEGREREGGRKRVCEGREREGGRKRGREEGERERERGGMEGGGMCMNINKVKDNLF